MSKSYDNAIYYSNSPDDISTSVAKMLTDPQRARKSDPGNPDICNVFEFHKLYSDSETIDRINKECRTAEIGCVECKQIMAKYLIKALEPMREKREYYEARPQLIDDIIAEGCDKARRVARQTMAEVRAAIKI
jgi:tryptophanyl-tRNA synthetase